MSPYTHIIKQTGRGKNHARDIDFVTARSLYHDILTGKVPDLELGALLLCFRIKGEGEEELRGFFAAMQARTMSLQLPAGSVLPIVIPSYNGARKQANLTPLLALLLVALAFPVVVHGISADPERVTSLAVFTALGIAPVTTSQAAQKRLNNGELVVMTAETLCPEVAQQLALRWRMGVRNSAHTLVKLATPFSETAAIRLTSVSHPAYLTRISQFFLATQSKGLILNGTEGEVYANPYRCPAIRLVQGERGLSEQIVSAQDMTIAPVDLPLSKEAGDTALWTEAVINKQRPVPQSVRLQIASCYVACGRATDIEGGLTQLAAAGY